MKTGATLSGLCSAKRPIAAAIIAAALASAPALAQEDEPVTDESVGAKDVAMTPISDLNLRSDPIPELLVAARADPYANEGLARCSDYAAAVRELDAILGVDWDVATPEERRLTAGKVAQSVVGSLIPFRGVIREVSGAADHERDFQEAILAGMMRRAYLKGMGLKLGCAYPARPADEATRVRVQAELAAAAAAAEDAED
ncbi:MAG TPA: hypothetical protein VLA37_05990 [Sphingomonadaceae bacterium]|nr:hypothetical protein [Sphingomonadaceae bacterium]